MRVTSNIYFNEVNPLSRGDEREEEASIFSVLLLIVLKLLVEAGWV